MQQLRPYQIQALQNVRHAMMRGKKRVLLVAPTGAGKGTIAAHLMASVASRGHRSLFVVHRKEIVEDVANRLRGYGLDNVGVWLGGTHKGDRNALVQVASVQTLTSGGHNPAADLVFWDEAHHAVAKSYKSLAKQYPNAFHLGATATPKRADGTPLGDVFESMVVASTVKQLTEIGVLVPCEVKAPQNKLKTSEIAMHPYDAWKEYAYDRPTVIFAKSIEHGERLLQDFAEEGVLARLITGETPKILREHTLAEFSSGAVKVLINAYVLTEGWDCPAASVCILARSLGSLSMYLQCIGRVLRSAPGKTHATLVDLAGNCWKPGYGLPDDDREYSLEGEGISLTNGTIPIRNCLSCSRPFRSAMRCPYCGFEHLIQTVNIPKILGDRLTTYTRTHVSPIERKRQFDDLIRIAIREGHRPGWVGYVYKSRFGSWPPWHIETAYNEQLMASLLLTIYIGGRSVTPRKIDALRKFVERITEGPWYPTENGHIYAGDSGMGDSLHYIGSFLDRNDNNPDKNLENAKFVALARTAIPELCDTVEEAWAEGEYWKARALKAEALAEAGLESYASEDRWEFPPSERGDNPPAWEDRGAIARDTLRKIRKAL